VAGSENEAGKNYAFFSREHAAYGHYFWPLTGAEAPYYLPFRFTAILESHSDFSINSLGPLFENNCGFPRWQWDSEASAASSSHLQNLRLGTPNAQGRLLVAVGEVTAHAHLYTTPISAEVVDRFLQLRSVAVDSQYCACAVKHNSNYIYLAHAQCSKISSPWCNLNRPGDAFTKKNDGMTPLYMSWLQIKNVRWHAHCEINILECNAAPSLLQSEVLESADCQRVLVQLKAQMLPLSLNVLLTGQWLTKIILNKHITAVEIFLRLEKWVTSISKHLII
jgi:hypothetical protein